MNYGHAQQALAMVQYVSHLGRWGGGTRARCAAHDSPLPYGRTVTVTFSLLPTMAIQKVCAFGTNLVVNGNYILLPVPSKSVTTIFLDLVATVSALGFNCRVLGSKICAIRSSIKMYQV